MTIKRVSNTLLACVQHSVLWLLLVVPITGNAQEAAPTLDLPRQPLLKTLNDVERVFDVSVQAEPELVESKASPAIQGEMTASEALEQALSGSGLVLLAGQGGRFTIQPAQRARGREMEEVFVRGVKEPLTLQQITASADVFTEDRLERQALFRVDEVIQRTPNVTGSLSRLTIRGVARTAALGAGAPESRGTTSSVYVDGAPASSTALEGNVFLSTWDVAQVEILRGPQSALQGRNALAGAVFITTNSPSYEWDAKARGLIAENDTKQYAGMVSGPLIDDQLAFRLTADYQTTDGYVDGALTFDDLNFDKSKLIRSKLLAEPDAVPGLRAELTFEYSDATLGGPDAVFGPGAVDDPAFADFDWQELESFDRPSSRDTDTRRWITDITYELSTALTARAIGTYEEADTLGEIGDVDDPGRFDFNQRTNGSAETYSGELQLLYERGAWSGLFGAYYYEDSDEQKIQSSTLLRSALGGIPVNPTNSQVRLSGITEGETTNYAFFFNTRYQLNAKWTLSAGLRYDNEAVDLRTSPVSNVQVLPMDCLIGAVSCLDVVLGFSPPEEDPQQELDFDAWLPRAAITYHVNDALSLFVSYQRGYRAGGTYLQADISNITERQGLIVREFDAEYLDDYEVGFRFVGLDNRLRFNGNAFYSLYKDQQVNVPGPSGTFVDREILNAAKSRSYGLELEADYIFNEQFDGFASLGLLKAEFRDFPWGLEGSPRENLKGNTLPGAPEVSGTVGLNYTHASGVFVNFSVSYQSAVESDIANLDGGDLGPGLTERTGALTLANSRIGYRNDHFTLYAYATNLFDDDTPTTINIGSASQEDESVGLFSNPRYNVTQPRTLGMVVEVSL